MKTSIFNTNHEYNNWSCTNGDAVIMPRQLKFDIDILINSPFESGGVLLCSVSKSFQDRIYLVEFPMILNKPHSAFATGKYDKIKVKLLQDLINSQKRNISVIWFHTHVKSTGDYWYDKFSGGDYKSFSEQTDEYKHVLFTPTSILTYSKEGLDFRFTKNTHDAVKKRYDTWLKIQLELHKV